MQKYQTDKPNLVFLHYPFMKKNIDIDYKKLADDIWVLKLWYLNLIETTIDSKNRVSLDNISISDSNKRTLVAFFKKKWFIGSFKLKGDSNKILYMNPYYNIKWKSISKELYDAFDNINNWKVY